MSAADVTVVIVTYNSAAAIDRVLDSLPAGLQRPDGSMIEHEVVVVDNGSDDDTAALVRKRSDCLLIEQQNLGYSAGINAGVRRAGPAEFALALNPDLVLAPGAVAAMLDAFDGADVGIVAPRVVDAAGQLTWSLRRTPTLANATGLSFTGLPVFSEYVTDRTAYQHRHRVDWALGAVLMFRRRVFEDLRGWDESYFLYSEETDFCLRARDLGWATVYEPTAEATHDGGGSGTSPVIHAMQIINRVRLYRRRHGAPAGLLYFLLATASELTWVVRGHPQSRTALYLLWRPRLRPPELGENLRLLPD
ncbi:GT2 family glycosyltransferase [Friedmanniella endophytica]|uniref:GT2 family glycosyltransferase n=1 Tax=Microlunatus kandeliicorticis TaxID=1759536 RepID=A0A7W3IP66_9ACTN|nr:glycosyltransferase family 2 protein [Microlunatus kandeliicorticis]MBA8792698.1 GT2 family glycosyltransferase [Microlunatus kandeliicorticis]